MDNRINPLGITTTVPKQTQGVSFGEQLKTALVAAGQTGSVVGGALLGALPGGSVISAAVSGVTAMTRSASTGVVSVGGGTTTARGATVSGAGGLPGASGVPASGGRADGFPDVGSLAGGQADFGSAVADMRRIAEQSMVMQTEMQKESLYFNAISNVIKVRYDSAKACINNIR